MRNVADLRPTLPTSGDRPTGSMTLRSSFQRYRAPLLAILVMTVCAWAFVIWSALNMDAPLARAMMPATTAWTLREAILVWAMWAIMMGAMMLPSAAPMILVHRGISQRRADGAVSANAYFVAAYLVAWSVFSVAAAGVQLALQALGVMSHMLTVIDGWLAAGLLVGAGIYQFTPIKEACLANCRTPIGFLMTEWRPGQWGAFRMGLRHGCYCIGCCWALMAALFVFGVMNLLAILLLTTAVAAEKLLPWGGRVKLFLGLVFVSWGVSLRLV